MLEGILLTRLLSVAGTLLPPIVSALLERIADAKGDGNSIIGSVVEKFVTGALGGVLEGRSEEGFNALKKKLYQLTETGVPGNHDLFGASRKAYIEATKLLCNHRLSEIEKEQRKGEIKSHLELESETRVIKNLLRYLNQQAGDLSTALPEYQDIDELIKLLRHEPASYSGTADAVIRDLGDFSTKLKSQLLDELRRGLYGIENPYSINPTNQKQLPGRLEEMVWGGWLDPAGQVSHRLDWFQVLQQFFAEEVKSNERVHKILSIELELGERQIVLDLNKQIGVFHSEIKRETFKLRDYLHHRDSPDWEVVSEIKNLIDEYSAKRIVGRENEFQKLDDFIAENRSGFMIIIGEAGTGKTALLANWIRERHLNGCFIAHHFFSNYRIDRIARLRQVNTCFRNLLYQIYGYHRDDKKPLPDDQSNLERDLSNALQKENSDKVPLVIVIDSLDEAEKGFAPPFPKKLPDGVFVIASSRPIEGEDITDLKGWIARATCDPIHMSGLTEDGIASWLHRENRETLTSIAADAKFVAEMKEKTEGLPLYLAYLIEDLNKITPKEAQAILKDMPKGFEEYIKRQKTLLIRDQAKSLIYMFNLITAALGAISLNDLARIIKPDTADELTALPREIKRWIDIREYRDEINFAFSHPRIWSAFSKTLVGYDREKLTEMLIRYCDDWKSHKSRYALRHYAQHLRDVKDWNKLFALAKSTEYWHQQAEAFPESPELPLLTIQTSLLGAADCDNAPAMTELVLTHATRLAKIKEKTPLEALREGRQAGRIEENLKEAWIRADLQGVERSTVWYLLILWDLQNEFQMDASNRTVQRLVKKDLTKLPLSMGKNAAYLMSQNVKVLGGSFADLQSRILSDEATEYLCTLLTAFRYSDYFHIVKKAAETIVNKATRTKALRDIAVAQANAQAFVEAKEIAESITDSEKKAAALSAIAAAMAEAQMSIEARASFEEAIKFARMIDDEWNRGNAMRDIAAAQAHAKMFAEAKETAGVIGDVGWKANALGAIAAAQAHAKMFAEAKETAEITGNETWKIHVQCSIGEAQAKAGMFIQAQTVFEKAVNSASMIGDRKQKGSALRRIATAQAHAKMFAEAKETAETIAEMDSKAGALNAIASAQADAQMFVEARTSFAEAMVAAASDSRRIDYGLTLRVIADNQIKAKMFAEAKETAKLTGAMWEAETLCDIAVAQANAQMFAEAKETAEMIDDAEKKNDALRAIAARQASSQMFVEAQEILAEMTKNTETMDDKWIKSTALRDIAVAQANSKMFAEAKETAEMIDDERWKADALRAIAAKQAKAQMFAEAKETAETISDKKYKAYALCEIGIAQTNDQMLVEAKLSFEEATKTARAIEGWSGNREEPLKAIVKAQINAKMFVEAKEVLKSIRNTGTVGYSLRDIAAAQANAKMFAEAKETAETINDEDFKADALRVIIAAQANAKMFVEAKALFKTITDDIRKSQTLFDIAMAEVSAQMPAEAKQTAEAISDQAWKVYALCGVGEVQARSGAFVEAQTALEESAKSARMISNVATRARMLGIVAATLTVIKMSAAAQTIFAEAIETARMIEDAEEMTYALLFIGEYQTKVRMAAEAQMTFKEAIDSVDMIGDADMKHATLSAIAKGQADLQMFVEAKEMADMIGDPNMKADTLHYIAAAQISAGLTSDAVITGQSIITNQNNHLTAIAARLVQRSLEEPSDIHLLGSFKKLMIPCAYYLDSAYKACGILAGLYPKDANAIAEIIKRNW